MFLITNKHFNSQSFGLETIFSCWLLLLAVALTCSPSDWLINDDERLPSNHLPRRVFPVRLQNLSQLHLDQTQSCRCDVWWRIRTRRSDVSLCFDFIYSPSFYFLWQKMVLLLSEQRGGGRCSSLNLSFRGRCDFFFYHRKTCGGSMGLFCECWGNSDVVMAGCYRVTFYSDFVCIKTWWMNFNCLIC